MKAANQDSAFFEVEKFAATVAFEQKPVFLNFTDTTWFAEAVCQVTFKGKAAKLSMFLKPEQIVKGEYKWVISSVKGKMFDIKPADKETGIMISPVENEIGFMNLPDISDINKKDALNYSKKSFVYDKLSAFNMLIYNDLLKINSVEKVVYHFNQVPDYIFSVEHFERAGANVGWLISNFAVADKERKDELQKLID